MDHHGYEVELRIASNPLQYFKAAQSRHLVIEDDHRRWAPRPVRKSTLFVKAIQHFFPVFLVNLLLLDSSFFDQFADQEPIIAVVVRYQYPFWKCHIRLRSLYTSTNDSPASCSSGVEPRKPAFFQGFFPQFLTQLPLRNFRSRSS